MRTPPRLLPGLGALQRAHETFQVGLRRPTPLPAGPATRRSVDARSGQVSAGSDAGVLDALRRAGLLIGPRAGSVLRVCVGETSDRAAARDAAASVTRHGDAAAEARAARRAPVQVVLHGSAAPDMADEVDRLLRQCGAGGLRPLDGGAPSATDGASSGTVVLVVSDGEPPRTLVDDLVRAGTVHLFLRVVESTVLLGPWVVPGVTGCLRCDDLTRAQLDPAWPLLVAQSADRTAIDRADGVPSPVEHLALLAAAAGAARDLVRHAEGLVPDSWSCEERWGLPSRFDDDAPGLASDSAERGVRAVPRHPACGCCCWDVAERSGSAPRDAWPLGA
ncbi:hypothetical protein KLP28_12700 [Nocardioidaceae bacterium]|nr:hypothetical protein KLP28_12700 [Nocardioidaceae bacterium]